MPKEAASFSTKFNTWIKALPEVERKNFVIHKTNWIYCYVCIKAINCERKSQLDQHIGTGIHAAAVKRSDGSRQPRVNEAPVVNSFYSDLCTAFLAADIPFNKLENATLKAFLEQYTNRPIPSVWTLRNKHVPNSYNEIIEKIREELREEHVWLGVDETTDKCGRFVANVMVGRLNGTEANPHLLMSRELETANNSTVTQLILDALHFLWPGKREADISKQFLLLLSDAAPYMVKTGKNLKKTYPGLLHVTCLAHGFNRVAETVRSCYGNVDKLIASIKAIFKKSPHRVRIYNEMLPGLSLPPEPVLTRWGTWLEAVQFLSANFAGIKSVIDSLNSEEAECIRKAQAYIVKPNIEEQIADVSSNYVFLINTIKKLETRNLLLTQAIELVEDAKARLSAIPSGNGLKINTKLEAVLEKNTDLHTLMAAAQVLNGNTEVSTGLEPHLITVLKYCPVTSVELERGFSMEKAILTDRRCGFTMQNLEMYVVCHFENVVCTRNENSK